MSTEPQRYQPTLDYEEDADHATGVVMHTSDHGDYVLFSDYEAIKAENQRLEAGLREANANHEKFERLWYLRGDEIERLEETLKEVEKHR